MLESFTSYVTEKILAIYSLQHQLGPCYVGETPTNLKAVALGPDPSPLLTSCSITHASPILNLGIKVN